MCINYMHGDRFLIIWEAFFVQCSYAMLLLLQSGSSHKQTAAVRFIDNVDCGRDSAGLRVSAVGHRAHYLQRMAQPNGVRAIKFSRRASFRMIARGEASLPVLRWA